MTVVPGQTLDIIVGGVGGDAPDSGDEAGGAAGSNGGGVGGTSGVNNRPGGGGGGGGSSQVSTVSPQTAQRVLVAGGGGGSGGGCGAGGAGGAQAGSAGSPATQVGTNGQGGAGATTSAVGQGGASAVIDPPQPDGSAGSGATGGAGANASGPDEGVNAFEGGGGAGGGWFGGGGGGASAQESDGVGGGGGGGSSNSAGSTSNQQYSVGDVVGDGAVTIGPAGNTNPPTIPLGVSASNVGPNTGAATVTWNQPTTANGITSYSVLVSDGPDGPWTAPTSGTCTTAIVSPLTCTVGGLIYGAESFFQVVANNVYGQSDPGVSTVPVVPIAVSTFPYLDIDESSETETDLYGQVQTNGSEATSIYCLISTNSDMSDPVRFEADPSTLPATRGDAAPRDLPYTGCEASGLVIGTTYYWQLVAVNGAGTGSSEIQEFEKMPTEPTEPGMPVPTAMTATTMQISAPPSESDGGSPITSYTFKVYTDVTGEPWDWVEAVGATVTCNLPAPDEPVVCDTTGLVADTPYWFNGYATNDIDDSDDGELGGPYVIAVPSEPAKPLAELGEATTAIVTPQPGTGGGTPTSYDVRITGTMDVACTVTAPETSCEVTGLTPGVEYTFETLAKNGVGDSATWSPESDPVTPGLPEVPQAPTAVAGNTTATVTVVPATSGPPATSYTVTAVEDPSKSCTVTPPATSCVVEGLTNGTPYTFTSTATGAGGTSAVSPPSNPVTPNAGAEAVKVKFVNPPTQVVPGEKVTFNLLVTSESGAPVNGEAVVYVNNVAVCTANIVNGKGSCKGAISGTGTLSLTAVFNGTAGSGNATGTANVKVVSKSVAIQSARLIIGRCSATLKVAGVDSAAKRTIKVYRKANSRWVLVDTTKSNAKKNWSVKRGGLYGVKYVKASDGKSKTGAFKVKKVANKNVRSC